MAQTHIYTRVVPEQFRTSDHVVRTNNIYRKVNDALTLVGQLEEGEKIEVSKGQLTGLCGGTRALNVLNAVGAVSSVINLGVCVLGFRHVSRLLRRIENRIERVEQKLGEIAELVGVVDQKVDQLIGMTKEQNEALARLNDLIVSFETAKVHAALETLAIRSSMPQSPKRDELLIEAATTLHAFRTWLAEQRDSTPIESMPVRAELLRAEVATVMAESRARCIADDAQFASLALQSVLDSARLEVERMYEQLSEDHIFALVMHPQFEIRDAVEAVSWLRECSMTEGSFHVITRLRLGLMRAQNALTVSEMGRSYVQLLLQQATNQFFPGPDEKIVEEALEGLGDHKDGALDVENLEADAASFIASYRLSHNLESAVAVSAAIEIMGEPVRELLSDSSLPDSPALVIGWNASGDDLATS